MTVRLSGTIMEPGRLVYGAGQIDGEWFKWEWNRIHRTRARIAIIPDRELFSEAQDQACRAAVARLDKHGPPTTAKSEEQ